MKEILTNWPQESIPVLAFFVCHYFCSLSLQGRGSLGLCTTARVGRGREMAKEIIEREAGMGAFFFFTNISREIRLPFFAGKIENSRNDSVPIDAILILLKRNFLSLVKNGISTLVCNFVTNVFSWSCLSSQLPEITWRWSVQSQGKLPAKKGNFNLGFLQSVLFEACVPL